MAVPGDGGRWETVDFDGHLGRVTLDVVTNVFAG